MKWERYSLIEKENLEKYRIRKIEIVVVVLWFVFYAIATYLVYSEERALILWFLGVLLGYIIKGQVTFFKKRRRLQKNEES